MDPRVRGNRWSVRGKLLRAVRNKYASGRRCARSEAAHASHAAVVGILCSRIEGTTATTLQCLLLTQTGHDLRREERYWSKPECGRIFSHDSTAATEAAGVPR